MFIFTLFEQKRTPSHALAACILLMVIGATNPSFAENPGQERPRDELRPVLDFMVLPSIQYAHTDIWRHTPTGAHPVLSAANDVEIVPGQRLDLLVFASRYGTNAEGQASITCDVSIHRPDGKIQPLPDPVVVADHAKTSAPVILLSQRIVSFTPEPDDPAGPYRFEFLAHDLVTGVAATRSVIVRVGDSPESIELPKGSDPAAFMTGYYQRPQPQLALPMLTALARSPLAQEKADALGALIGFHAQILADNPWLLSRFCNRFTATADRDERHLLALVLAYATRDNPAFREGLTSTVQRRLVDADAENLRPPTPEPTSGGQLDILWGQFFASGRFEPIASLVNITERYLPYLGKMEAFRHLDSKPKVVPPEVYKDAILGSAIWSLRSNASRHKLVHDYLLGLQESNTASPARRRVLSLIIGEKTRQLPAGAASH